MKTTFADRSKPNCETRTYTVHTTVRDFGRTRVTFSCPFCQFDVTALCGRYPMASVVVAVPYSEDEGSDTNSPTALKTESRRSAMACKARQFSDQMHCHKCGLVWDMNDPDPPECRKNSPLIQPQVDPATNGEQHDRTQSQHRPVEATHHPHPQQ